VLRTKGAVERETFARLPALAVTTLGRPGLPS
jgi:hypothetical protein